MRTACWANLMGEGDSSPRMAFTTCDSLSLRLGICIEVKVTLTWFKRNGRRDSRDTVGRSALKGVQSTAFREARICNRVLALIVGINPTLPVLLHPQRARHLGDSKWKVKYSIAFMSESQNIYKGQCFFSQRGSPSSRHQTEGLT